MQAASFYLHPRKETAECPEETHVRKTREAANQNPFLARPNLARANLAEALMRLRAAPEISSPAQNRRISSLPSGTLANAIPAGTAQTS